MKVKYCSVPSMDEFILSLLHNVVSGQASVYLSYLYTICQKMEITKGRVKCDYSWHVTGYLLCGTSLDD